MKEWQRVTVFEIILKEKKKKTTTLSSYFSTIFGESEFTFILRNTFFITKKSPLNFNSMSLHMFFWFQVMRAQTQLRYLHPFSPEKIWKKFVQ